MKKGIYKLKFDGFEIRVCDIIESLALKAIYNELRDGHYDFSNIDFKKGDIVVDIGAHVGVISMYLAKKYPDITVYSYEPFPDNFSNLYYNVRDLNNLTNIKTFPKAVTSDGRRLNMICNVKDNTGGATSNLKDMNLFGHKTVTIDSVTLDSILEDNNIEKCKLLKIDCEGSEHEILYTSKLLNRIEYLVGEFHINNHLENKGYSLEKLMFRCFNYMERNKVKVNFIRMAE